MVVPDKLKERISRFLRDNAEKTDAVFGSLVSDSISAEAASVDKIDTGEKYSWSDYAASRSLDTWYQAPSDHDIVISMQAKASATGTEVRLILNINTSQSQNRVVDVGRGEELNERASRGVHGFRVPAGQYYKIEAFGNTADYSINKWAELRT